MDLEMDTIQSPLGKMTVITNGTALCALDFEDCRERMETYLVAQFGQAHVKDTTDPNGYSSRLRAYFSGELNALEGIIHEARGTPFQREVWETLRKIPAGTTICYGELATSMGRPKASRAVGMASARNPVGLVVPCHRVIGADGTLTGFASGIERKRWLLKHEGAVWASAETRREGSGNSHDGRDERDGDKSRTLAICKLLVDDEDDMVVKGLSWRPRRPAVRDRAGHARVSAET